MVSLRLDLVGTARDATVDSENVSYVDPRKFLCELSHKPKLKQTLTISRRREEKFFAPALLSSLQ